MRLACASLLGAAVAALLLALGASGAEGTLPFLGSFGGQGEAGGQFKVPWGVAVDGSNGTSKGDVYVADQLNQRVEKFSSAGTFILSFGTQGEAGGQFSAPMGVAVDSSSGRASSGDVYVIDFTNKRVEKFTEQGEFLLTFGKEVDAKTKANVCTAKSGDICQAGKGVGAGPYEFRWAVGSFVAVGATGTVYVGDENRIQRFDENGENASQVELKGAGKTTALSVDSGGNLYVVSQALKGVHEYEASGKALTPTFDSESSEVKAVSVQQGSGDVYLVDSSGGVHVRRYASSGGSPSAESKAGLLSAESSGIAVNASGTLYATDSEDKNSADTVLLFGEPPTEGNPPPAVDAETVSEVGEQSATLEAQINPYFVEPTSYRVQYVAAAGYKTGSPNPYEGGGEAPSPAGAKLAGGRVLGDQPAPVALEGLSPGTYHYRFVASNAAGKTYGPDQEFTTFRPRGSLAGLPDGRAYEQVSSQQKNGNEAGMELNAIGSPTAAYATAVPSGDRVAYVQGGPSGQTSSGTDLYSVSNRAAKGWETSAVLPPEYLANGDFLGQEPLALLPSADLSRFLFVATGPFTSENSRTLGDENLGLYRTRGNAVEPEWVSKPTFSSFSEAKPEPGKIGIEGIYPVGGSSPDLSTVYFTYFGTLVGADASRAPLVQSANTKGPFGFYEWKEGALRSAGVLPGEHSPYPNQPDPYGAVPAVTGTSLGSTERDPFPRFLLNEVSQDGSKAFFVSPEPRRAEEAKTPTELYVREQTAGGPRTVLVSRDEGGMPAAGEPGAEATTAVTPFSTKWAHDAYVYASPDGSRAFFLSRDELVNSVNKKASPEEPWTYEFNLQTEKVTHLPGVEGPIVTSSQDGSSFIFLNTTTHKIELWSGGPAPVEIGSYSTPAEPEIEGAAAPGGTVFVFDTNAVLTRGSQGFNNSAALAQSYRYDAASQTLSCVSCAPPEAPQRPVEASSSAHPRMIADEGRRVFFGTTAKLLSRDTNGVADVYEWEKVGTGSCHAEEQEGGCIYLISSGTSRDPSFYLENDESGDNVFFSTKEGLVKGDTDESYDVYDARVNGGFPEEVPPTECAGACRRGSGAPPLASPLTTALGPSGNLIDHPTTATPPPPKPNPKPLTRAQKLAKALRACRHRTKKHRAACLRRARAQYASRLAGHGHHGSGK